MNLRILDTDLNAIAVVDTYKSSIWSERYNQYGDFELYTMFSDGIFDIIKQDYYLQRGDSDRLMIIEQIQIKTDIEEGTFIIITGKSLESILMRRVVWGQKVLTGSLQDAIQTLLNECLINPSNRNRKVSNFIFEASTDSRITDLKIDTQYTGDNLYDVIESLCSESNIGFKVVFKEDTKQFVFSLYSGEDRSYEQTTNPYVVFSPSFENIITSNYIESKSALKNVTLVGGEGEGSARRYTAVGDVAGLDRREMFTDARDISSDVGDGKTLTDEEYIEQLRQRGKEDLAENIAVVSFEGEAETSIMFKYGEDFFIGDVVQIADGYGHETKARILEIVTSEDEDGSYTYPTFSTINEEGESETE